MLGQGKNLSNFFRWLFGKIKIPQFPSDFIWLLYTSSFFSNLHEISKKTYHCESLKKFWTLRCNSNRRSWLGRWAGEIDKSDFLFMSRKPESLERFQLCMSPNSIFKNCPFFYEWCNQPGKMSSFLFLHTHNEVQIISKWNLNF